MVLHGNLLLRLLTYFRMNCGKLRRVIKKIVRWTSKNYRGGDGMYSNLREYNFIWLRFKNYGNKRLRTRDANNCIEIQKIVEQECKEYRNPRSPFLKNIDLKKRFI